LCRLNEVDVVVVQQTDVITVNIKKKKTTALTARLKPRLTSISVQVASHPTPCSFVLCSPLALHSAYSFFIFASMASQSIDPSVFEQQQPLSEPLDYSENDDEVDQLDSDSDQDNKANVEVSSVSSQKFNAGRDGERIPGHSLLPVLRLENIIQADGK
jgi:hypothetical protein